VSISVCLTLPFCQLVTAHSEPRGNLDSTSYKHNSESSPKQSRLVWTDQAYGKASTPQQDTQTKLLKQIKELSSRIEQLDADVKELKIELHNQAPRKQQLSSSASPIILSPSVRKTKAETNSSESSLVISPKIVKEPPLSDMQLWVNELRNHDLAMPVKGTQAESIKGSFYEVRSSGRHEAVDIPAPRGTPVLAVEGGSIARLFTSKAGGLTIYQRDPTKRYIYYYAHLDRYADNLREGDSVKKQQIIGFVDSTGNAPANYPHLHFSISRMPDEASIFHGVPIDPYEVFKKDSQQLSRPKHLFQKRE